MIFEQFPNITWHGNKYIRIGPDERLYIDLGAPCNDCILENAVGNVSFGSLNSMRLDGSDLQPYATGACRQSRGHLHLQNFIGCAAGWQRIERSGCKIHSAQMLYISLSYSFV